MLLKIHKKRLIMQYLQFKFYLVIWKYTNLTSSQYPHFQLQFSAKLFVNKN